jgi:hypothetical protein
MIARQQAVPIFLPVDEVKVFQYLAGNAHPGEIILASNEVSNPLPAWAPVKTIGGHGPESMNGAETLGLKKAFFQPQTPDSQRIQILSNYQVAYVVWGPYEKAYGSWDPGQAPYLEQVLQVKNYRLFKVNLAETGNS